MTDVSSLYAYAVEYLEACNQALATTVGGAIDRAYVTPGLPVIDCCPMLAVDVRSLFAEQTAPTGPPPVLGHRGVRTPAMWLVALVATVARCTPTVQQEGVLPNADEMEASAREIDEDVWAIWNMLLQLKRAGELFGGACRSMYLDPPTSFNSGGCAGWFFQIRVPVDGYRPSIT